MGFKKKERKKERKKEKDIFSVQVNKIFGQYLFPNCIFPVLFWQDLNHISTKKSSDPYSILQFYWYEYVVYTEQTVHMHRRMLIEGCKFLYVGSL